MHAFIKGNGCEKMKQDCQKLIEASKFSELSPLGKIKEVEGDHAHFRRHKIWSNQT